MKEQKAHRRQYEMSSGIRDIKKVGVCHKTDTYKPDQWSICRCTKTKDAVAPSGSGSIYKQQPGKKIDQDPKKIDNSPRLANGC
jgi:hypothetical protein